jgi:hypothetical protein
MRRKHCGEIDLDNEIDNLIPQNDDCHENADQMPSNEEKMDGNTHDISVKEIALFALKTQEFNRLSDTATDTILENTCELLEQNEEYLKAQVKKCIKQTGLDPKDIEGLEDLLESQHDVSASMKQLKTSKERNKYLRDTLDMVVSSSTIKGLFTYMSPAGLPS